MGYDGTGPYQPNFIEYTQPEYIKTAQPYIEPDKSSKTTAIFQGISGLVTSAADFYSRIKYKPQPVAGRPGDPNIYYGGGVSYVPGQSGEPGKLAGSGFATISPMVLFAGVAVIGAFLLLRK
jgi:hypothetical protein